MVTCASCGTENPEGARFCYSCGAAIGVAKFLFWAGIIIAVVLFLIGMTVAKKVT